MQRGVPSAVLVALLLLAAPADAARQVWFVPWKVLEPGVEAKPSLLAVYWIPASSEELRRSDLLTSRALTTYSGRCVAMHVVRIDDTARIARFSADALPIVVLARTPHGGTLLIFYLFILAKGPGYVAVEVLAHKFDGLLMRRMNTNRSDNAAAGEDTGRAAG